MTDEKRIEALILERDEAVVASIEKAFQNGSYHTTVFSTKEDAIHTLKERLFHLALVGEAADEPSVFQIMKEIVTISPMTSMILVTDLPEKEVDDSAEGYGILGSIGRMVPLGDLTELLDRLRGILGAL